MNEKNKLPYEYSLSFNVLEQMFHAVYKNLPAVIEASLHNRGNHVTQYIMSSIHDVKATDTKGSGTKSHLWGAFNLDSYAVKQIS